MRANKPRLHFLIKTCISLVMLLFIFSNPNAAYARIYRWDRYHVNESQEYYWRTLSGYSGGSRGTIQNWIRADTVHLDPETGEVQIGGSSRRGWLRSDSSSNTGTPFRYSHSHTSPIFMEWGDDIRHLSSSYSINSFKATKTVRSRGSYNTIVSSTNRSAYPDDGYHSGYWYEYRGWISANKPPTTPSSISVPNSISSNEGNYTVSWGLSTDPDGDSVSYRLERQVNGGSWSQVYSGSTRSKTESALTSWNTVRYRVRAYDGKDYSSYRTSSTITVTHNRPPTTPPSISVPSFIASYNNNYNVTWGLSTDPDGDSITYILQRKVNNGSWSQVYSGSGRNYRDSAGVTWNTVQYRVKATDGVEESSYNTSPVRTVTHNRPPTTPPSIFTSDSRVGVKERNTVIVNWGKSTDPDGDSITYILQRKVNNGSWSRVYSGSGRNYRDTITNSSWNSIQYRVKATDGKEDSGYKTSGTVYVDSSGPNITLSQSPTEWTNGDVTISVSATDGGGVRNIENPDGSRVSRSNTTYTVQSNGTYTFKSTDEFGNTASKSITIGNIDKIDPGLTLTPSTTRWTNRDVTITVTTTGGLSGVKSIRGPGGTVNSSSTSYDASTNGTYSFTVEDNAGNTTTKSITIENIDKIIPEPPTINPSSRETAQNITFTLTGESDSGGSGVDRTEYKLEGAQTQGWATYNGRVTISSHGETTIKSRTVDKAGNISKENSISVILDKNNPTATGISLSETEWTKNDVTVTLNKGNALTETKAMYKLSGATNRDWTDYTGTIIIRNEGKTTITAKTVSNVGRESTETSAIAKVDKTSPNITVLYDGKTKENEPWRLAPMPITIKATDEHSGVKRMRFLGGTTIPYNPNEQSKTIPRGNWVNGDLLELPTTITENGIYYVQVEDYANNNHGSEGYMFKVERIDDRPPKDFELYAVDVQSDSIKVEVSQIVDEESGPHTDGAVKFKLVGDKALDSGWIHDKDYTFENLNPNVNYNITGYVRDMANNMAESNISVHTLVNDIILTMDRKEGSNRVDFRIDLNGNSSNTETRMTRQNMSTGELIYLSDTWKPQTLYTDRVSSFAAGFRYTAYARNGEGLVGNPANVEIRDKEEPNVNLRGFGTDRYVWDGDSNSLFIVGKHSGYIIAEVHTIATERLGFIWSEEINGQKVELVNDYQDRRTGEVRYELNLPVDKKLKSKHYLDMRTIISGAEEEELEKLKMDSMNFKVYHVEKWSDLLEFDVIRTRPLTIKQLQPNPTNDNPYKEVIDNAKIREEINKGIDLNGKDFKPNQQVEYGTTPPELLLSKPLSGGVYTETIKSSNINITTNIRSGVTETDEDGNWKLEGEILVEGNNRYKIPEDIQDLVNSGYYFEMIVAPKYISNKTTNSERWEDLINRPDSILYTKDNINSFNPEPPYTAHIGFKVGRILPTYKFETLNLQKAGYSKGSSTLEAYGNSNIQYDKDIIYNRMVDKSVRHEQEVIKNNKWISELYYRVEDGIRELVLVTRDNITIYDVNSLEHIRTITNSNNTGSIILNNKLYIGTVNGLFSYKIGEAPQLELNNMQVNHIATNGVEIFIANNQGIVVLDGNLNIIQEINNSDLGISRIYSLFVSQGKIYVGITPDGNEFRVLGK